MKRIFATTTAILLALGTSAFAANSITTKGVSETGNTLTVPMVKANADGYLVIHAMKNGHPVEPQSVGHAAIHKGENDNVQVTLDHPLKRGQKYLAMLHKETNNNGTYDFGKGNTKVDTPMMANGKPVTKTFRLSANAAGMSSHKTMSTHKATSGKAMTNGSTNGVAGMSTSDQDMDSDAK
ncbi:hypothetical protein [Jiella sp. M17.18]|uniref:DUF7282 domain-containing protein n=1 Tax=Jiella sp. M17.18 TaxID=3234247 RepID=UPI0034DFBA2E